ncbi:MAG: hypothetical protein AAGF12_09180 [Myxococcota bacterium]
MNVRVARSLLLSILAVIPVASTPPIASAQTEDPSSCLAARADIAELRDEVERTLESAEWNEGAPEFQRLVERRAPEVRQMFLRRDFDRETRTEALSLLVELNHESSASMFRTMLRRHNCPPPWTALAARGAALQGTLEDVAALDAAFVAAVPSGRTPDEAAWAMCTALRTVDRAPNPARDAAVRRLFLFAPHAATGACMPLVAGLPDAAVLARRILDGDRWPEPIEDDGRQPTILEPFGRGAALLVLAQVGADGAMERMQTAFEDRSLLAAPTRDGAIQGLAILGGSQARETLRRVIRDPELRSPRAAHGLLRLGAVGAANDLRDVALDGNAIVELRIAAANAYTHLVEGRRNLVRDWNRDVGRAPPFGPPFEAFDHRMRELGQRLDAAERCRGNLRCWLDELDGREQRSARAFFQLTRRTDFWETADEEALFGLTQLAVRVLATTPPNQEHDRVAGAIAILARIPRIYTTEYVDLVRAAKVAWRERSRPLGLPFDIGLALGQLENRIEEGGRE